MFSVFKHYKGWLVGLGLFSIAANGLPLLIPRFVAQYIDLYQADGTFDPRAIIITFVSFCVVILAATLVQFGIAAYLSERVALDLRRQLAAKLRKQTFRYIVDASSSKLLTNMTSDVDAIKNVIAQGLVGLFSAALTFFGVIVLMFMLNVKLTFIVLSVLPVMIGVFIFVFKFLGPLFGAGQMNIEKINKIINESVVASALVRVLNAGSFEKEKFDVTNKESRQIGFDIVKYIAIMIPAVIVLMNVITVLILWFGGHGVTAGTLSFGEFNAFFAYSAMFIWPLFVLAFSGTMFSRAAVSFTRVKEVLDTPIEDEKGTVVRDRIETIRFDGVSLELGGKRILSDISFEIKPRTKNAIVGPTAAGKTQLFYMIAGLISPNTGTILAGDIPLAEWKQDSFLRKIGLVFQDSILFNSSVRENIQFRTGVSDEAMTKALESAQLTDLVESLPRGLDSVVSERGTNLSGGQKQRLMLARALAQNPEMLLLDDFTARVDIATEQQIISNIENNYPDTTLISISQKIDPIKNYDQIIVIMEGELIDKGTHEELLERSIEYRQIYESQQKAHE